jgi:hypothetical protein
MTARSESLAGLVEAIESKANTYDEVTNAESKRDEYRAALESIERSILRLQRRLESLEFHAAVLVDVLEARERVPTEVVDVRESAQSVVDHDEAYFYEVVDEGRTNAYTQRVQQVQSEASSAMDVVETYLRQSEREWRSRVNAARNVQQLFGGSPEAQRTLDDIESFVGRKMWDDANTITSLASEWRGLMRSWANVGVDWATIQRRHGLSDETVAVLKQLADGDTVALGDLDEGRVAQELLSIEKLHDVVQVSI